MTSKGSSAVDDSSITKSGAISSSNTIKSTEPSSLMVTEEVTEVRKVRLKTNPAMMSSGHKIPASAIKIKESNDESTKIMSL